MAGPPPPCVLSLLFPFASACVISSVEKQLTANICVSNHDNGAWYKYFYAIVKNRARTSSLTSLLGPPPKGCQRGEVAEDDWLRPPRSASSGPSADSRGPGWARQGNPSLGPLPADFQFSGSPSPGRKKPINCGAVKGYKQGKKSACVMSTADSPSKDDLMNAR
ncbi:hypothetical protein LZ30DRAFT_685588 [Colletotrichum cereale]|nr:hypothetical protein LZ30DRAFT_685588 [Colletotrichum cereale]